MSRLSSHDVNTVSAVALHMHALPKEYLESFISGADISDEAKTLAGLLLSGDVGKPPLSDIAQQYREWVNGINAKKKSP